MTEKPPGQKPEEDLPPEIENPEGKKKKRAKGETPFFIRVEKFISSRYDLQYNIVRNEVECRPLDGEQYLDLNENNLFRELQHNNIKISMTNLLTLLKSDFIAKSNPFEKYFKSLSPWEEGDPDYITALASYVKAKDQEEFQHHFKKMLVRTVVCSLVDSYYNKQAFVLVGKKQNTGKTTYIRFLCPPALKKYFSENISLHDKDTLISLADNFIINIDELAALNKIEINQLKSFFSKDSIKVRHPYDRRPITSPRRASFFGSTNKSEFLSDDTGSVRWLCFEITAIDFDYSKDVNIDRVWAQAYYLSKSGFQYQLSTAELEKNEKRNQIFQHSTMEIELLQKHFTQGSKESGSAFFTASELVNELSQKTYVKTTLNNVTVGKALIYLGYEQKQEYREGSFYPVKGYYVDFLTSNAAI